MCNKAILFIVIALFSVSTAMGAGAFIDWNNSGTGDSFCVADNWIGSVVPGRWDGAIAERDVSSPYQGPVIDCNTTVNGLRVWPSTVASSPGSITMDVTEDLTILYDPDGILVHDEIAWDVSADRAGETAGDVYVNISGSPVITCYDIMRCIDKNKTTYLNISGNPTILFPGGYDPTYGPGSHGYIRGADYPGANFRTNMSGGYINCDSFRIGDGGSGSLTMTGGTLIGRTGVTFGGAGQPSPDDNTISISGDNTVIKTGTFGMFGGRDTYVHLDGGVIDCGVFGIGNFTTPPQTRLLDIEKGTLRIGGDNIITDINDGVTAGWIKAYNGGSTVEIRFDPNQNKTFVTADTPNASYADDEVPWSWSERVDPNAVIGWTPGSGVTTQKLYFGTSFDDVNDGTGGTLVGTYGSGVTEYDPNGVGNPMAYLTRYYWRVDSDTYKGQVWNFKVAGESGAALVWYKLDEENGLTAYDSSGMEYDATVDVETGQERWDPDGGFIDGALNFNDPCDIEGKPLVSVDVPSQPLADITDGITVTVWLKDAYRKFGDYLDGDNWVFDTGDGSYFIRAAVTTDPDPVNDPNIPADVVYWRAGTTTDDVVTLDLSTLSPPQSASSLEGWHNWAFRKDESLGEMHILLDGEVVATKGAVSSSLSLAAGKPCKIGARVGENAEFSGTMDDFIIYPSALTDVEIKTYVKGGDPGVAWKPQPFDGKQDVPRETDLSWDIGDYATHHDVYFGTDFDDVNDATTSDSEYMQRQVVGDVDYDPTGDLSLATTYYWRIDEVNTTPGDSNIWPGPVWSFTTANFLVFDDMESYDASNKIYFSWENPDFSGSFIDLGTFPIAPVHGGTQTMVYQYFTTDIYSAGLYYAEIEYTDPDPCDWTAAGIKSLSTFFYGQSDNDANSTEQMYLGLEDSAGDRYDVNYPDMSDLLEEEWHQWDLSLPEFTDGNNVDQDDIKKVYLGFGNRAAVAPAGQGTAFVDDFRLYPPRCIPELGNPADLSGNCVVDYPDIAILGEQWLLTDAVLAIVAPSPGPVGLWEFEGDANDTSGNGNHGTASGTYSYVTGKIGSGAIEFGPLSAGRVTIPDAAVHRPADELTATAWVNIPVELYRNGRILVKGSEEDDTENFTLEIDGLQQPQFSVRASDTNEYVVESDDALLNGEWYHIAGTYDGSAVNCYLNGQLNETDTIGSITLMQDVNDMAIGNAVDAEREFIGIVDDVRLYNYGLSAAQIAYIATEGSGYFPLTAPANLIDTEPNGQKAVNFRDYAVMMTSWLTEQLWPE